MCSQENDDRKEQVGQIVHLLAPNPRFVFVVRDVLQSPHCLLDHLVQHVSTDPVVNVENVFGPPRLTTFRFVGLHQRVDATAEGLTVQKNKIENHTRTRGNDKIAFCRLPSAVSPHTALVTRCSCSR